MASNSTAPVIRLRGVRQNNLRGFDLDLPQNRLIVITGRSGSGKSSLAFDTLFAEGQRRYIETFTPYARQFFDRMDKPRVDSIEGIPPAIAIEQRNAVRTTRSTVGTMTEVCDYLKVLWPHLAQLHCQRCGQPVRRDSPQAVWRTLLADDDGLAGEDCLVTFDLPLTDKFPLDDSLALVAAQGYQRLLVRGEIVRIESLRGVRPPGAVASADAPPRTPGFGSTLTVVQDRIRLVPTNRARFIEACEQAYHFGKGRLAVSPAPGGETRRFSNHRHCAQCDLEYREPTPALFSFNHPVGACAQCKGFGRVIEIDYQLAIPDRGKTLAGGAVKPWQSGMSAECQQDLAKFCRARGVPMDVPFRALSEEHQRWVLEGDPGYGEDEEHQWPRAWYGVKGYFRWLESKAYKMHVRVLLSRYRAYTPCPACQGQRLKPEALLYRLPLPQPATEGSGAGPGDPPIKVRSSKFEVRSSESASNQSEPGLSLAQFYALPVREALRVIETLWRERADKTDAAGRSAASPAGLESPDPGRPGAQHDHQAGRARLLPSRVETEKRAARQEPRPTKPKFMESRSDPVTLALDQVRARLGYLVEVGLGYLTLDRATRTLSGGETERVNLTTCLGSLLVNTLFVLDEPSVGLHSRDTDRLIHILERLRDAGNTVVVVEHEASVMRAADRIVDLGPGHGETGGQVVFQGDGRELLRSPGSLTGQYLSGQRSIPLPTRRPVRPGHGPALSLTGVTRHNLRALDVVIPLGRFVVVTGVSGSGKSTLIRDVLYPLLAARLATLRAGAASNSGERGSFPDSGPEAPDSEATDADTTAERSGEGTADQLHGWEALDRVVMVDQAPLGRTPRSNPAVYIGAFEDLRELFAASSGARERGFNASAFSFNSRVGQCERCRGAGFEKIEMQFLSDVFIRCPDCDGRRYRAHILGCRVPKASGWSIADLLDATVEEALRWLGAFPDSTPGQRAMEKLRLLEEVGLGYLRLGQPINTLSGGESQRLKLAAHLAAAGAAASLATAAPSDRPGSTSLPCLFLFDEPTTGLHFEDVRILLGVFQRLVDTGHSVLVIEHNLEVIKCADWVIDLGPEAGEDGGRVVVCGTPETAAACEPSHTGRALRTLPGFSLATRRARR